METSLSLNVNTSTNNLNLNRTEINIDNHHYKRKISIGSSSLDDNSRYNNPYIRKVTYIGGIRIQQFNARSSATNLKAFNMISISGNICPRCSKNVYSAEEVKAVGKVNQSNSSFFNMKSYFSHFINNVIIVLIVKEVLVVLVILNIMVNFMITVR